MSEPYRELRPGAGGWGGLELGALDDLGDEAPEVLWARGDENLWLRRPIAIVGSRASTAYGELVASQLAADLAAAGHSIIVEVGYGIALAAMRGALAQEGHVLALSAAGIDSDYPRAAEALNQQVIISGTVLTEQPPDTPPTRKAFLRRSRLAAALASAVIVVEGASRSSAAQTAQAAHELGRLVMAVPGPVTNATSYLPHKLIQQGTAKLVTGSQDVLDALRPTRTERIYYSADDVPGNATTTTDTDSPFEEDIHV